MRPQTATEKPNIDEKGSPKDGVPQSSDTRLFMQLLVFTDCLDTQSLIESLDENQIVGALYQDINDPYGVALLTYSEDPAFFVTKLRDVLQQEPFAMLTPRPDFTMFGRTYSIGYEPDLKECLFDRPIRNATQPDNQWAIWYPLRRSGKFETASAELQREILMEHGSIGRAYGEAQYASDIRLACHGLDQSDNDFIIGLVGKELHPLSALVQRMRKTKQTSQYLQRLGPFFIGKVAWQNKG